MDTQTYYASQSTFTDPGGNASLLADFPKSVPEICTLLRGLMLPFDDILKYPIQNERVRDTCFRTGEAMLGRLAAIDKRSPVSAPRPGEARFVASSSDFANLFVCVARHQGIPARKRCGFVPYQGEYYGGEKFFRIHDVAQYWSDGGWKWVDPNGLSREEDFIFAAAAWQDCRVGKGAPDLYRDEQRRDFTVLTTALLLDLAALGKRELCLWDRYGFAAMPFEEFHSKQWETLDHLAELLQQGDAVKDELAALYEKEEGLKVPEKVLCDSPLVPPHEVELSNWWFK